MSIRVLLARTFLLAAVRVTALSVQWQVASKPLFKRHAWFGEDAHACASRSGVVTDGVGGIHHRYGTSSAEFAQALAKSLNGKLASGDTDLPSAAGSAFETVERKRVVGAATLAMVALRGGQLQYGVVGDALVRVYHPNPNPDDAGLRCIARAGSLGGGPTRGAPPQLRIVPKAGRLVSDSSALRSLKVGRTAVEEGDLLLLASDGLIDNLDDDQIQVILERARGGGAARALADGAARSGLKPDDVTVMVGVVVAK